MLQYWKATLALALMTVSLGASCTRKKVQLDPLSQAQEFYASRIPIERPQGGYQELPEGLPSLSASVCGACHQEIYNEWKVSTHAQAWTDRQFQEETKKSENRWLCDGCHTPLLNQMETWVVEVKDDDVEKPIRVSNPNFDKAFQDEGITCAACHVRDGFVEGPYGNTKAPHASRKAERFTSEKICTSCHQAVQHYPGKTFVCTFETGEEWERGPYPGEGKNCQSCHMPEVDRPLMVGFESRKGRKHFWPGGGVYKVKDFGPPRSELPAGLEVQVEQGGGSLEVALSNSFAGHMLPTGDPERYILVEITFLDAADKVLGEQTIRIGQKWKWWPKPEKLGDNRLAPKENRKSSHAIPSGAKKWKLRAASHRISEEALKHHNLEGYPASRITHELSGEID